MKRIKYFQNFSKHFAIKLLNKIHRSASAWFLPPHPTVIRLTQISILIIRDQSTFHQGSRWTNTWQAAKNSLRGSVLDTIMFRGVRACNVLIFHSLAPHGACLISIRSEKHFLSPFVTNMHFFFCIGQHLAKRRHFWCKTQLAQVCVH